MITTGKIKSRNFSSDTVNNYRLPRCTRKLPDSSILLLLEKKKNCLKNTHTTDCVNATCAKRFVVAYLCRRALTFLRHNTFNWIKITDKPN